MKNLNRRNRLQRLRPRRTYNGKRRRGEEENKMKEGQKFNKEIEIKINGKKVSLYKYVQDQRADTEINQTIEKYNIQPKTEFCYADLSDIENMGDIYKKQELADRKFSELPIEIQNIYGKNRAEFAKDIENNFSKLKNYTQKKYENNKNTENNQNNNKNNSDDSEEIKK